MARPLASRYLRRVATTSAILIGALLVVALVGEFFASPYNSLELVIVNFFITTVIIIALQMFTGNSGCISYGHAAFVGIGAYVAAWLTVPKTIKADLFPSLPNWLLDAHWSFLPTVIVATLAGTLVAAVIGVVLARMKPTAIAMSTLALLVIAHGVFSNWQGVTRGAVGVYGLPQNTTLWVAFFVVALAVVVGLLFRYSHVGLCAQASREDSLAAEASGVGVVRTRYIAWVASAALAALAGSVWAQFNLAFDPSQFYYTQVFAALSMLVIGGMATMSGAVIGAAVVTVLSQILLSIEAGSFLGISVPPINGLQQMVLALITLLILIYRRDGIMAWWEVDEWSHKLRMRVTGRKAARSQPAPEKQDSG